jgi:hypothetical protein
MLEDLDENGGEVSDPMSENENEYDDDTLLREDDDKMAEHASSDNGTENTGEVKKKYDPKDPLRPRRKKARRACFACQRAHLTCGKLDPWKSTLVGFCPNFHFVGVGFCWLRLF